MATLKTHLLYEALDIAIKTCSEYTVCDYGLSHCFMEISDPKDFCTFAISSVNNYRLAEYVLKEFATHVTERKGVFCCDANVKSEYDEDEDDVHYASFASFSPKYHIRALLNFVGRHCKTAKDCGFKKDNAYLAPFIKGLEFNEDLDVTGVEENKEFFLAAMKNRKFIKSLEVELTSPKQEYNCLQHVGDAVIETLIVTALKPRASFGVLKNLKIKSFIILESACYNKVSRDIFGRNKPQMKYLKEFDFGSPIGIDWAIKMLEHYNIDDMCFRDVRFVQKRPGDIESRMTIESFEECVQGVQKALDRLWKAIEKNEGAHTVATCNLEEQFLFVPTATIINYLTERFPGIEITEGESWKINGEYQKSAGYKWMNVNLTIQNCPMLQARM